MISAIKRGTIKSKLEARTEAVGDCIEWCGPLWGGGYGCLHSCGVNYYTHRLAFELYVGPIPDGLVVMHSCDNKRCVNPDHLSARKQEINMRDMKLKRMSAHGTRHPKSKLTQAQILEIRSVYPSETAITHKDIADRYGVARSTITKVLSGASYEHV